MHTLIYDSCFSLSDLLHPVCQTLGPSTSSQMIQWQFFLWLSTIPLYIYAPHFLSPFLCGWTSTLLPCRGCCINKCCCNKPCVHVSLWIVVFSGFMPRCRTIGSYGSFIFKETSTLFSTVAISIYIPSNSARGFPFLLTLSSIVCRFFWC